MATKKILIVDDDHDISTALESCLIDEGYRVWRAVNWLDLLKIFISTCVPDLILLDLVMPGIDGIELLQILKSDRSRFLKTPVIVLSGLLCDKETISLYKADGFLSKPIDLSALLSTIEALP